MFSSTKRRAFVLTTVLIVGVLALLLLLRAVTPSTQIPLSAFDDIDATLVRDGFRLDQNLVMVDQIALGPFTGLASRLIPGVQKRSASRVYVRNGAKLGIDYSVIPGAARVSDISITSDAPNSAEARKISRALAELNPNLALSVRTNAPLASAK